MNQPVVSIKGVICVVMVGWLIVGAGLANAAQREANTVCPQTPALREGADIFKNFSEIARSATQSQYDAAMAAYRNQSSDINFALSPTKQKVLSELLRVLDVSWKEKKRTDVVLYSIQTYQLLIGAASTSACPTTPS